MNFKFATLGLAFSALAVVPACSPMVISTTTVSLTLAQSPVAVQGLVGSSPRLLDAEFGEPALRRVDGTAQVWIYHTGTCGLNLILYPDQSGTPRVAVAATTNDTLDQIGCTDAIQRAHADATLEHAASS